MKLVCYPNNTGGGLVCNLLNLRYDTNHYHGPYDVNSVDSNRFFVGDTATIQTSIDTNLWNHQIELNKHNKDWGGTHAHPSAIPNLDMFDEIIVITTQSRLSKLYRWLRYYYGLLPRLSPDWHESDNLDAIDKIRCLAYNVFEDFLPHNLSTNVEFEDIVSGNFVRNHKLNYEYFKIWQQRNPWLYPINYSSYPVLRFNEAEYEILHKTAYKYI